MIWIQMFAGVSTILISLLFLAVVGFEERTLPRRDRDLATIAVAWVICGMLTMSGVLHLYVVWRGL